MTVPTLLNLTTAEEIQRALAFVGIQWAPSESPNGESGLLYAWGIHANGSVELHDFAVLYIGKDVSAGKRLRDELRWSGDDYIHGHALAIQRTQMTHVSARPYCELQSLDGVKASLSQLVTDHWSASEGAQAEIESCMRALDLLHSGDLSQVEYFAIRVSIHVGDVGAPINSSGKNAWALKSPKAVPLDNLAYWAALHLKG